MNNIIKKKIDIFKNDGFVVFENILDKKRLGKVEKNFKNIFYEKYSTNVVPDKIKWKSGRDPKNIPRSLCNVWKSDNDIARIVCSEKISHIAAQLMNWNSVRLNQDSLIWLVPNAGCVNFHQDNPYQDWHLPGGVITCWIPITDTEKKSGSLEYLVGSNKKGNSTRLKKFYSKNYRDTIKKYINKEDNEIIETMSLKAGSVVFHSGKTVHGSGFNKTKKDRISLSIHFMNGNSRFHPTIKSPYFNHYKLYNTLRMEESFFPITWSKTKKNISKFIKNF